MISHQELRDGRPASNGMMLQRVVGPNATTATRATSARVLWRSGRAIGSLSQCSHWHSMPGAHCRYAADLPKDVPPLIVGQFGKCDDAKQGVVLQAYSALARACVPASM